MNRISVIICFLMMSVFVFGQKDTINKVDANNQKQGYWVVNDENGKKVEEGKYLNNSKVGLWKSYFTDGTIKQEITFIDNKPDGYAKFYYPSGVVSEEGIWKGNKWVGEYKYFFPNGKPSYEWKYSEQGKRTGVQKYYHENGKIMIEGEWNEGKESGPIKEYDENGKLVAEKTFNNGLLDEASVKIYSPTNNTNNQVQENTNNVIINDNKTPVNNNVGLFTGNGFNITYTKDRKKEREGEWKDGKLIDGKRYYYDETGKLTKTSVYKNGNIVNIIYNE
ncbi:MAG: toxin-antitoxin system YwqK family antitoxin [Bacteroidia bacterium]|nr:toxin-antitoxin system YwqK family antitoxin [Bacteroidia bacterium]